MKPLDLNMKKMTEMKEPEPKLEAWFSLFGREELVALALEQLWGILEREEQDTILSRLLPTPTREPSEISAGEQYLRDLRDALGGYLKNASASGMKNHPLCLPPTQEAHAHTLLRLFLDRLVQSEQQESALNELWGMTRHPLPELLTRPDRIEQQKGVRTKLEQSLCSTEPCSASRDAPPANSTPAVGPLELLAHIRDALKEGLKGENPSTPVHAAVRLWATPRLLNPQDGNSDKKKSVWPGYIETHCHFAGAIPIDPLWETSIWTDHTAGDASREGFLRTVGQCLFRLLEWVSVAGNRRDLAAKEQQTAHTRMSDLHSALSRLNSPGPELPRLQLIALCLEATFRQSRLINRLSPGLEVFSRRYARFGETGKHLKAKSGGTQDSAALHAILDRFRLEGAAHLELRIQANNRLRQTLNDTARAYFSWLAKSESPLGLALIVSLNKGEAPESSQQTQDPHGAAFWHAQAALWRDQLEDLAKILEAEPLLRLLVVGIDAASKERGCPPRALADALASLRAYHSRNGIGQDSPPGQDIPCREWHSRLRTNPESDPEDRIETLLLELSNESVPFRRLGITLHAGEDFVDPLTGLRHIDECIRHLGLTRGDRIGHAIALALSPCKNRSPHKDKDKNKELPSLLDQWLETHTGMKAKDPNKPLPSIQKPRGEHLLDLAWLYQLLGEEPSKGRDARALDESFFALRWAEEALSGTLAQAFTSPGGRTRARTLLQGISPAPELNLPGVRYRIPADVDPEDHLLCRFDPPWRTLFECARRAVLRRVVNTGLVIESCPTSNRVVAGLQTAPLTVFLSKALLYGAEKAEEELPHVVLATDDPGIFDAWPSAELRSVCGSDSRTTQSQLDRAAVAATWLRSA